MLKILVGHSYFLRFDQKQWARGKPYPPLATLQVAAGLRGAAGHKVSLFDAMLAGGVEDYVRCLRENNPQVFVLYEDNFNFLSKMCLGRMRDAACQMIAAAQVQGTRVIVAGSDASDAPEAYLKAGADVVLIGEGLSALMELIRRLDANPDIERQQWLKGIAGVVSYSQSPIRTENLGGMATEFADLPAWDMLDIEKYRAAWRERHGYFSLNLAASRGCSFRCNWCSKPIWGNQYRQRSPYDVAAEISHLKRKHAPDHIWFADDIFGFRADWVSEFAGQLRTMAADVPFTIQSRPDLISCRMARALKDAGCVEVWIGAESGSQRMLDAMNKGTKVANILLARDRLAAENIRVGFFVQLGYLDEQLPDLLATRDLIARARPDDIGVSVAYPLPGTKFYEQVKAQLGAKTRWQQSDDLAMMFKGTYDSEFYKLVRDQLHELVSTRKLDVVGQEESYQLARQSLEQRWDSLISREMLHRSETTEVKLENSLSGIVAAY